MPRLNTTTTWTKIANGTTNTASEVNRNFEHVTGVGNSPQILPYGGSSMGDTNGAYNLGSVQYGWRKAYVSSISVGYITQVASTSFQLSNPGDSGIYMTTGASIINNPGNARAVKGWVTDYAGTTFQGPNPIYSKFVTVGLTPTSGVQTVTVWTSALDTFTVLTSSASGEAGSSYVITKLEAMRYRPAEFDYVKTPSDVFWYTHTTTAATIYGEINQATFSSAQSQTLYVYFEYSRKPAGGI